MYNGPQRKLNRAKFIDYSLPGFYYLTICTKNQIHWFGDVHNKKMRLNDFGKIANEYWKLIPRFYKNTLLDEYIIMPNHIHGIIRISSPAPVPVRSEQCSLRTGAGANYGQISKIIKSFKNECTNHIRNKLKQPDFSWKKSFYDHLVRNQSELDHARSYIRNNPQNYKNTHTRTDRTLFVPYAKY